MCIEDWRSFQFDGCLFRGYRWDISALQENMFLSWITISTTLERFIDVRKEYSFERGNYCAGCIGTNSVRIEEFFVIDVSITLFFFTDSKIFKASIGRTSRICDRK